ncbi:MAG: L-threonylcarbamoyladenylate synthase [Candidatus ainarchaeum sp.]|nr:L-threonylcarbamoyladenylate synthase [Candidatus ainarchaeum sp.]
MKIIKLSENFESAVEKTAEAINKGKIVVYPTDTVYGIGGNALDKKVVDRIYLIKKREKKCPLSVIIKDLKMIEEYCKIGKKESKEIKKYFPGPYTLLVKRSKKKIPVTKTERLGIRVPEYRFIQEVMKKITVPLITTSANISGKESPVSFTQLSKEIVKKADLVIDGGETKYKCPSNIIDIPTGRVLREFVKSPLKNPKTIE